MTEERITTIPQPITLYQRKPISDAKNKIKTTLCATQAAISTGVAPTRRTKNATANSPKRCRRRSTPGC